MNKTVFLLTSLAVLSTACVSQKKYKELQTNKKKSDEDVARLEKAVKKCDGDMLTASAKIKALEEQVDYLKKNNEQLINNVGNITTLTQKGAENLEKSLEAIKEKDTRIKTLQDALTKKDSVTIALVTSIKSSLGNMDDKDIEVNVDKGVVFVSIADKMLFQSGSYKVTSQAKNVLGKVATVAKAKPDFEIMVEGHTDNVPVKSNEVLVDNWDLSVLRSTSIVRVLTNDLGLAPERIIAAGRSEFVPLVANDSVDGKARNRRTRIILLPKIDQFYKMVEEGMKQASEKK
ncbi:MAG TPA: OmpA family protein [Cytophagales bacterium]|nr:OmpA family protein [Cytophagales bacterium]